MGRRSVEEWRKLFAAQEGTKAFAALLNTNTLAEIEALLPWVPKAVAQAA